MSVVKCKLVAYGPADATAISSSFLFHQNPEGFTFLMPFYPGYPGIEALNEYVPSQRWCESHTGWPI